MPWHSKVAPPSFLSRHVHGGLIELIEKPEIRLEAGLEGRVTKGMPVRVRCI